MSFTLVCVPIRTLVSAAGAGLVGAAAGALVGLLAWAGGGTEAAGLLAGAGAVQPARSANARSNGTAGGAIRARMAYPWCPSVMWRPV
jgi:hypothetical protein